MMTRAWNPSIQEVEAGGSGFQGSSQLQNEFQVILGFGGLGRKQQKWRYRVEFYTSPEKNKMTFEEKEMLLEITMLNGIR